VRRRTVLGCCIGDGGGNEGSIALRIEAVDGRGIARGRADETAAFGAAVMVVLGRLFSWIHHVSTSQPAQPEQCNCCNSFCTG
jgi:hypothetical protein